MQILSNHDTQGWGGVDSGGDLVTFIARSGVEVGWGGVGHLATIKARSTHKGSRNRFGWETPITATLPSNNQDGRMLLLSVNASKLAAQREDQQRLHTALSPIRRAPEEYTLFGKHAPGPYVEFTNGPFQAYRQSAFRVYKSSPNRQWVL